MDHAISRRSFPDGGGGGRRRAAGPGASGPTVLAAGAEKPALLGGRPVRSSPSPPGRSSTSARKAALLEVLHSGKWFRGDGRR